MKRIVLLLFVCFLGFPVHAERFVPQSDLIPKVLEIVKQGYVDQNRVQPLKMLEGSLERVSAIVAPVLTQMSTSKGTVTIKLKVDQHSTTIEAPTPNTIKDLDVLLQKVARFIKTHLDKGDHPETVDYALINGFLKQLDPHTILLVPEVYSDFSTNTSGNFGGVGMMIGLRKGQLTIISPIDGTPASRARLRAKDKIVQINEESTVNMSLSDAVGKLRGEVGSNVTLYIMREGLKAPKPVIIKRALITIKSVESEVFEDKGKRVGYIQIKTFQKNTADELNIALASMDHDLKSFKGLILDLRNNPGGLLSQAIQISDRFLNKGVIVSTAGLDNDSIRTYKAHWFSDMTEVPLVVLINNGSASASEIVAAALKKNNRAVVIGTQSFGKGSVQQVIDMRDGSALKITTQKYLTPGNISIQSVGVSPHIEVDPYYISQDFVRVTPAEPDTTEDSLKENFREWGDLDKAEKPEARAFYLTKPEPKDKEKKTGKEEAEEPEEPSDSKEARRERIKKDILVKSGIKILLTSKQPTFRSLLNSAHRFVTTDEKIQNQSMSERFKEFKINWTSLKTVGKPKLETTSWVEIKKGKDWSKLSGPVPAKSDIRLYLQVKNAGKGNVSRLVGTAKSKNPMVNHRQFAFGSLRPGETKKWYLPIEIPQGMPSRNDLIAIKFIDEQNRPLPDFQTKMAIKETPRPHYSYQLKFRDQGASAKGNGNKQLNVGETIAVDVTVTNDGKGTSGPVTLLFKNGEDDHIFLKQGRKTIKSLAPGASKTETFSFDFNEAPTDGDLDLSFDLIDGIYTLESSNQKFKVPLESKAYSLSNHLPGIFLEEFSNTSGKRKYQIRGTVADKEGVKDIYAFVGDKKVFYQNFSNQPDPTQVPFSFEVDLSEKDNRIILVSRDASNVAGQKTLYIRYDPAN